MLLKDSLIRLKNRWRKGPYAGSSETSQLRNPSLSTRNPPHVSIGTSPGSTLFSVSENSASAIVSTQTRSAGSDPAPETCPVPGKCNTPRSGIKSLLRSLESSTTAFGPLKSAISGLSRCIGIYERALKERREYEEVQKKLEELLGVLAEHVAQPMGLVMTNSVKRLCFAIEAEIKNVEEKHTRNTGRRLFDAIEASDEIFESYRRICGHVERLTLNANLSILQIVNEQAVESRLMRMAPSMSAIYHSAESDDIQRGGCTPGTREPQIDLLLKWAHDPEAGRTCWINGMAGTGKTTIAYSVCGKLDESSELGASFFCSRLIPECRQVKHIIPSITYQLARFSFPFRCALHKILESDPDTHTRALKIQYQKLLVEPLLEVRESLPADFIVVIDALDECENENALGQFLDLLLSSAHTLPIRFLVSSRPEVEIYRRMIGQADDQGNELLVLHDLDVDAVRSDIEAYMRHELAHIPLTDAQWSDLITRCGVLFIYASTMCRYIEQGYIMENLDEAVNTILTSASAPIEPGDENIIDELYSTILTAAFHKTKMSQADKRRMKNILETVICAQEPMSLNALANLIGLGGPKQVDALLQPLRSVLNVTTANGLVTTLHASFLDFMTCSNRSTTFHCKPAMRYCALAKACLQMIEAVEPKFNICGLPSSYLFDNETENIYQRVKQSISPGLLYACRYWSTHLYLGEYHDELVDAVHGFFSARLLIWMEILNLTKNMRFGTTIIHTAEKWCSEQSTPTAIAEIVRDGWQFVSAYATNPVCQSTAHIYASMLPFWPQSRPISVMYMPRATGMLQPTGTAITRRQTALLATWKISGSGVDSISLTTDGTRLVAAAGEVVLHIEQL